METAQVDRSVSGISSKNLEATKFEVKLGLSRRGTTDEELEWDISQAPSRQEKTYFWVIRRTNHFRMAWSAVIGVALMYIATVFPVYLCFVEFRIPVPEAESSGWITFKITIDIIFSIDLFLNFIFTYEDQRGNEVTDPKKIANTYLRGYFFPDLLACLPLEFITVLVGSTSNFTDVARFARIQRLTRLTRLMRLGRITKFNRLLNNIALWKAMQQMRGIRICNFMVGLLFIMNLMACGWYLCASLHSLEAHQETWLARRIIDGEGTMLIDMDTTTQWIHSMYFILTIFSTVGFGDMSAVTSPEIFYVCFVMLVGAVVHSIIVSEMINVVTSIDDAALDLSHKRGLVEAFAQHTYLDEPSVEKLKSWLAYNSRSVGKVYDRKEMRELLTSGTIPREILGGLPCGLFAGQLMQNQFVKACASVGSLPPRLPLLLALQLQPHMYSCGDSIYHAFDHPFNLFLVLEGTFACVAKPSPTGGVPEPPEQLLGLTVSKTNLFSNPSSSSLARSFAKNKSSSKIAGLLGLLTPKTPGTASTSTSASSATHDSMSSRLFPYQLISARGYFGDVELFSGMPRHTTVRCESTDGTLLVLPKKELVCFLEEFPHYADVWAQMARRREWLRERMLQRLDHGKNFKFLAASTIQSFIRQRLAQAKNSPHKHKCGNERYEDRLNGECGSDVSSVGTGARETKSIATAFGVVGSVVNSYSEAPARGSLSTGPPMTTNGAANYEEFISLRSDMEAQHRQLQVAIDGITRVLELRDVSSNAGKDIRTIGLTTSRV